MSYRRRHEVLVNGRKQGATKKAVDGKATGSSALCKKSLFDACKHLLAGDGGTAGREVTYAKAKLDATSYRHRWSAIRRRLGCWTVKPEALLDFTWLAVMSYNCFLAPSNCHRPRTSDKMIPLTAIILLLFNCIINFFYYCRRYLLQLRRFALHFLLLLKINIKNKLLNNTLYF